jgi:hypothetical protein
MIYNSAGAGAPLGAQLVKEFLLNLVIALFAAYLLSLATGVTGYVSRVGFVTLLGLTISLLTNVQYWNWYGFPLNYTIAAVFIDLVGFLIIGLIAAAIVKANSSQIVVVPARAA